MTDTDQVPDVGLMEILQDLYYAQQKERTIVRQEEHYSVQTAIKWFCCGAFPVYQCIKCNETMGCSECEFDPNQPHDC